MKPLDAFAVLALNRRAGSLLDGGRLEEIASAGRDRLQLIVRSDSRRLNLVFDLHPAFPHYYLAAEPCPAEGQIPRLWTDHLDRLIGAEVRAVPPTRLERLFQLDLESPARIGPVVRRRLTAELIPGRANLYLTDSAGRILAVWRHLRGRDRPLVTGSAYREPSVEFDLLSGDRREAEKRLKQALRSAADPLSALRSALSQLAPRMAEELLRRVGADPDPPAIIDELQRWLEGAGKEDSPCYLYPASAVGPFISAVHLDEDTHGRPAVFETVSQALDEGLRDNRAELELEESRSAALGRVERLTGKYRTLAARQQSDLDRAGRWREYRRAADLLSAQIYLVKSGAVEVTVNDLYGDPEAEVVIPLDPELAPGANVKRYVKLARKGERGEQTARRRLEESRRILDGLGGAREVLREASRREEIEAVMEQLPQEGRGDSARRKPADPEDKIAARWGIRPRRFRTSGGRLVLVGRSARENDILVTRVASPWDLWFHVRGAGGSHVLLLRPERKTEPSRPDIEETAAIAAWFSKQRGAGRVVVDYTERRNLKKPRGAPIGAVLVNRSETVLVRPGLPAGEED